MSGRLTIRDLFQKLQLLCGTQQTDLGVHLVYLFLGGSPHGLPYQTAADRVGVVFKRMNLSQDPAFLPTFFGGHPLISFSAFCEKVATFTDVYSCFGFFRAVLADLGSDPQSRVATPLQPPAALITMPMPPQASPPATVRMLDDQQSSSRKRARADSSPECGPDSRSTSVRGKCPENGNSNCMCKSCVRIRRNRASAREAQQRKKQALEQIGPLQQRLHDLEFTLEQSQSEEMKSKEEIQKLRALICTLHMQNQSLKAQLGASSSPASQLVDSSLLNEVLIDVLRGGAHVPQLSS